MLDDLFASDPVRRLGWMLLHSLWQLPIVAAVAALLLALLRSYSPHVRYVVACGALAAMSVERSRRRRR